MTLPSFTWQSILHSSDSEPGIQLSEAMVYYSVIMGTTSLFADSQEILAM